MKLKKQLSSSFVSLIPVLKLPGLNGFISHFFPSEFIVRKAHYNLQQKLIPLHIIPFFLASEWN